MTDEIPAAILLPNGYLRLRDVGALLAQSNGSFLLSADTLPVPAALSADDGAFVLQALRAWREGSASHALSEPDVLVAPPVEQAPTDPAYTAYRQQVDDFDRLMAQAPPEFQLPQQGAASQAGLPPPPITPDMRPGPGGGINYGTDDFPGSTL